MKDSEFWATMSQFRNYLNSLTDQQLANIVGAVDGETKVRNIARVNVYQLVDPTRRTSIEREVGFVRGQQAFVDTFNTELKAFEKAWVEVAGNAETLFRLVKSTPGKETIREIKEVTSEMIGGLENLKLTMHEINNSPSPLWIDVDELQSMLNAIIELEGCINQFFKNGSNVNDFPSLRHLIHTNIRPIIKNFDPAKAATRGAPLGIRKWRADLKQRWLEIESINHNELTPQQVRLTLMEQLCDVVGEISKGQIARYVPKQNITDEEKSMFDSLQTKEARHKTASYRAKLLGEQS